MRSARLGRLLPLIPRGALLVPVSKLIQKRQNRARERGASPFQHLCQTATVIIWRQSLHLCGSLVLGAACFNGSTPRGECVGIEACRPFATRVEPLGSWPRRSNFARFFTFTISHFSNSHVSQIWSDPHDGVTQFERSACRIFVTLTYI